MWSSSAPQVGHTLPTPAPEVPHQCCFVPQTWANAKGRKNTADDSEASDMNGLQEQEDEQEEKSDCWKKNDDNEAATWIAHKGRRMHNKHSG